MIDMIVSFKELCSTKMDICVIIQRRCNGTSTTLSSTYHL